MTTFDFFTFQGDRKHISTPPFQRQNKVLKRKPWLQTAYLSHFLASSASCEVSATQPFKYTLDSAVFRKMHVCPFQEVPSSTCFSMVISLDSN